jgi:hypothetical protein
MFGDKFWLITISVSSSGSSEAKAIGDMWHIFLLKIASNALECASEEPIPVEYTFLLESKHSEIFRHALSKSVKFIVLVKLSTSCFTDLIRC